jgi:predicted ATP-grasp superfamily ATP-dependent carboligase
VPHTDLRKTSCPRGSVLIAAVSGRALARAAVDAGLKPLVADFFADTDTQALATACRKLPGDIACGFQWGSLSQALEGLAKKAPSPLLGLVYGSGFEDRPDLLMRIAARWPLLCAEAETVARIKSPETFFAALDRLGVAHPKTVMERPPRGAGWIAKRWGGAGGSHVVPSRLQKGAANVYYQELIEGRAISALFVANGRAGRVIGFSEQWTAPALRRPWRYGGAVQPAALTPAVKSQMEEAVASVAWAFRIRGLASADFIMRGRDAFLIEINPRPGATLDIFANARPLLGLHLDAVRDGKLPRKPLVFEGAAASAIIHAPRRVIVPRNMVWPDWAADLPKPGEQIDKQRPICTVLARAGTRGHAKRLAEIRKASLLAKIQKLNMGEDREQQEKQRKCGTTDESPKRQYASCATGVRSHR